MEASDFIAELRSQSDAEYRSGIAVCLLVGLAVGWTAGTAYWMSQAARVPAITAVTGSASVPRATPTPYCQPQPNLL